MNTEDLLGTFTYDKYEIAVMKGPTNSEFTFVYLHGAPSMEGPHSMSRRVWDDEVSSGRWKPLIPAEMRVDEGL